MGQLAKPCGDPCANRPGLPGANRATVSSNYWNDFRGRAGKETFFGSEDIVPCDLGFGDPDSKLARDLEHDCAGDSAQRPGRNWRCENLTALDDEDVVRGALGYVACVV